MRLGELVQQLFLFTFVALDQIVDLFSMVMAQLFFAMSEHNRRNERRSKNHLSL